MKITKEFDSILAERDIIISRGAEIDDMRQLLRAERNSLTDRQTRINEILVDALKR